jgi:hypothetical protein
MSVGITISAYNQFTSKNISPFIKGESFMANKYSGLDYHLEIVSRTILGIVGGFAFSMALTLLLTRLLPMEPRYATTTANMLFFIVYACTIMWAFANIKPLKAWIGLGGSTLILWVAVYFIPGGI